MGKVAEQFKDAAVNTEQSPEATAAAAVDAGELPPGAGGGGSHHPHSVPWLDGPSYRHTVLPRRGQTQA